MKEPSADVAGNPCVRPTELAVAHLAVSVFALHFARILERSEFHSSFSSSSLFVLPSFYPFPALCTFFLTSTAVYHTLTTAFRFYISLSSSLIFHVPLCPRTSLRRLSSYVSIYNLYVPESLSNYSGEFS